MVNLSLRLLIQRNSTPRQDVLSVCIGMIDIESNSIPKFGRNLPFVNQPRRFSLQQPFGIRLRHYEVLPKFLRLVHVDDASRDLLGSCRLSAPFRAFNEHCAFGIERIGQKPIENPIFIFFHAGMIPNTRDSRQLRCGLWRNFVVDFGEIPLWTLATSLRSQGRCSARCTTDRQTASQ